MASYELNNLGQLGPELNNYEIALLRGEYQNLLTIEGYEISDHAKSFVRRYGQRSALDPYGTEETFKSVYERVVRRNNNIDALDRDQAEARQRQGLQDAMNSAMRNQRYLDDAINRIDPLAERHYGTTAVGTSPANELSMTGIILEFDRDLYDWIVYKSEEQNTEFKDLVCGILMHHKVNEELDLERDPIAKINAEIKKMKEESMNVDK